MKKLNQQGVGHHLMIIAIAVLVVGAVGFAGFRVYKGKNSDSAQAAGWTAFGNSSYKARVCKSSGGLMKIYFSNYSNYPTTMTVRDITGSSWSRSVAAHSNSSIGQQYFNAASISLYNSANSVNASVYVSNVVAC